MGGCGRRRAGSGRRTKCNSRRDALRIATCSTPRPVSGLASGPTRVDSGRGAFPCLAQWRMPRSDWLTVAGAVPEWRRLVRSEEGVSPASRFNPGGASRGGHLEAVRSLRDAGGKVRAGLRRALTPTPLPQAGEGLCSGRGGFVAGQGLCSGAGVL
ncbi:hypothetical protein AZ78_2255 [Lysobacter capsici AZ78]|uniref:Uncharacterized protein n=1 Tax=Lysobacter capsici AZ78 TaxID=1444315 RepID=A0A108U8W8_9GAMM|nr:hypothetical protein AZ78_2255 [Lysobacter capsici AZ78]